MKYIQLVLTQSGENVPIFKSEKMKFIVDSSINATEEVDPDEYISWIDIANEKIAEINECIRETNNLNIEGSKVGTTATITITKKDGTSESVELYDGIRGPEGPTGPQGIAGPIGVSIDNIAKTSTDELIDTYTITYSNGNTSTFTVTNGRDGTNGTDGLDGYSPYASVEKTGDTAVITIEDQEGTTSASITDGYSPTATVTKVGNVITISITDKNGTTTSTVTEPDMTNYSTKTEIDNMIGNINTILATLTTPSNGGV